MKRNALLLLLVFVIASCKKESSTIITEEFYSEIEVESIMKKYGFEREVSPSSKTMNSTNKGLITKKQLEGFLKMLNDRDTLKISGTSRLSSLSARTTDDDHPIPETPASLEETTRATKPYINSPTHNKIFFSFLDFKSKVFPDLFHLEFYINNSYITSQPSSFTSTALQVPFPLITWTYNASSASGYTYQTVLLTIWGTLREEVSFADAFVFYRNYTSKFEMKNAGNDGWIWDNTMSPEFLKATVTIVKLNP